MRADAVGEVLTTVRAEIRVASKVGAEFGQMEAVDARRTLDGVVPTMEEQKSALLGAQYPRPSAIDVSQAAGAEDERVSRPDRSGAAGTRPRSLFHQ
jgi:hypothetical protein